MFKRDGTFSWGITVLFQISEFERVRNFLGVREIKAFDNSSVLNPFFFVKSCHISQN